MSQSHQMLLFAAVVLSVTGGVHAYLWLRMVRDTGIPTPWREIATSVLAVLWLSLPVTFLFTRNMSFDISRVLTFGPYTWLGVMMLLFFAFLSVDIVKLGAVAAKQLGLQAPPMAPGRRLLLGQVVAGVAVLTVAGAASAGVARAARKPAVRRRDIVLPRLPESLDGLRIVQISDLHIGITVGASWLTDLVSRINALEPDVIAITGDLVDGDVQRLGREAAPLRHLSAKHGVFFVTGNHEYYSGADAWIAFLRGLGITVLRNEAVAIGDAAQPLYIAGVDDYTAGRLLPHHGQDVAAAVKDIAGAHPVVLLAHQPKAVDEAHRFGVDLVLSGHTHGGQIWPFNYLVGLQQPYNKGWYRHSERTQIYVNQGTFLWGPPMRLGTECEITELALRTCKK